jgi:hypothetical protein
MLVGQRALPAAGLLLAVALRDRPHVPADRAGRGLGTVHPAVLVALTTSLNGEQFVGQHAFSAVSAYGLSRTESDRCTACGFRFYNQVRARDRPASPIRSSAGWIG